MTIFKLGPVRLHAQRGAYHSVSIGVVLAGQISVILMFIPFAEMRVAMRQPDYDDLWIHTAFLGPFGIGAKRWAKN